MHDFDLVDSFAKMSVQGGVLESLRKSSKGRLKYDSEWFQSGRVKNVLEECTSPPALAFGLRSPTINKDQRNTIQNSNESNNKSKEDSLTENGLETTYVKSPEIDPVSPKVGQVELVIKEYEEEWQTKARVAARKKREEQEKEWQRLQKEAEQQLERHNRNKLIEAKKSMERVQAFDSASSEEVHRRLLKQQQDHKNRKKFLDDTLRAGVQQRQQLEEKERQRQLEIKKHLDSLNKMSDEIKQMKQKASDSHNGCQFKQYLPENVQKCVDLLLQITAKLDQIIAKAQQSEATEQHVNVGKELQSKATNALDLITSEVEKANQRGKEENEKKQQEQKQLQQQQQQQQQQAKQQAAAAAQSVTAAAADSDVVICVPEQAYHEFTKKQNKLQDVEKSYEPLTTDPRLKSFKFSMQKAVNTPINAISPTNGSHLRDKLEKLVALLGGQTVEVGGKRVTANDHPAGVAFCKDLFAKKIVKQGEDQVSSNFESSFAIAMVTVGVWSMYSDVGDLLLAHFHNKCPYIVPYYKPKEESQSSEDYHKSLGYVYVDGQCEKQDKFLKRMSGIMRLYAAIIVSSPPRGAQQPHPHGIEHGWTWLCNILNLEPRPDITATLLYDFLQVTGYLFMSTYKKQFFKLLHILCTEYMPKLKAATPPGAGGPVQRLEGFLENVLKKKSIAPPEGLLMPNFWFS